MKIRQGFVSNSSSQSFIVRGIRVKKDIVVKTFNAKDFDSIRYRTDNIVIEDTRDFFDGEQTDDCIVGISMGDLEDGVVMEIPNSDDGKLIEILRTAGFADIQTGQLSTFVQYISNDNY